LKRKLFLLIIVSLMFKAITSCSSGEIDLKTNTIFLIDETKTIHYANFNDKAREATFFQVDSLKRLYTEDKLEVMDIIPLKPRELLIITRKHGLYTIKNIGEKNEYLRRIDTGLPWEMIYPFNHKDRTKPIISHAVSVNNKRIALLFSAELYLSFNGGYSFKRAPLIGLHEYAELLSVAWHPDNQNLILLGTSVHGLFYSTDGGDTVQRISKGLPGEPMYTADYPEEIRSICFGDDEDSFFLGFNNGCGVWQGSISRKEFHKIKDSTLYTYPDGDFYMVENLAFFKGKLILTSNRLWREIIDLKSAGHLSPIITDYLRNSRKLISLTAGGEHLTFSPHYKPEREFKPNPKARGKKGLYISYTFTQKQNYNKLLKILSFLKLNAVVINLKDDYGSVRVPTDDPILNQVPEAVDPYLDIIPTIKKLKQDGIYVIGRMVLFKDEHLYKYDNYKYAVKDTAGHVFLKGPEMWVDAYSEFVWDYNIRAARAIIAAGVDEIQFDYVRFPDIRNRKDTRKYDFKKDDQTMKEALVSFLKKARENITVPISIDLFGYMAISKIGNWIGQDITELAQYADVVSPMFYPSHYGGSFASRYGDKRIFYIIYLSCKRAQELIGSSYLRPYIQAFYYKENTDNYCVDYIGWELDGLKKNGITDYIFWNDLHEYLTLLRGMSKYQGNDGDLLPPEILANIPKKLPFSSVLEKEAVLTPHLD
jgi:hypothetical protein